MRFLLKACRNDGEWLRIMGNQEVIYHSFNIYNSRGHRCGFLAAVSGLPIATLLKPLRSSLYASFSVLLPTKNSSLYNRVRDRAMYTSIPIMEKALQKSFVPTLYFTSLFLFLIYLLWIREMERNNHPNEVSLCLNNL